MINSYMFEHFSKRNKHLHANCICNVKVSKNAPTNGQWPELATIVHNFADQRKDEHFFMASGAFNLKKLNCQFFKNVSHLNALHFATSILI